MKKDNFIKIPADFKSLHDLKELTTNYTVMMNLFNALNGYQDAYVDSLLMSYNDLISYIPEKDWSLYKISNHESYYTNKYTLQDLYDNKNKELSSVFFFLKNSKIPLKQLKTTKCFLVNHNEKKLHMGNWVFDYKSNDFNFKNQKTEYIIDNKKQILYVKKHFEFEAMQAVGGVWINGRERGYLSGHTYNYLKKNGHLTYKFCTNTNTFIGENEIVRDEYERWIDTRGRRY